MRQSHPWLIIIVCGSLLAGVVGAGCESNERESRPPRPGEYRNAEAGFSIVPPPEWEMKENFGGATVLFSRPASSSSDLYSETIAVGFEDLPRRVSLEEYMALTLVHLERSTTNYELLEDSETRFAGQPARRIVYLRQEGPLVVKIVTFTTVVEKRACIIMGVSSLADFDRYSSDFDATAASFRIE